ncbi:MULTISPECIES: type IA DNA topoisomerase [Flavobacteriaceae]|uniref:type IA DNA topoisomerase n=1 Tax=Flavobacteriaceae TaxID=49546 RepID=UPI0014924AD5|nr:MULTISPECIES: type IA DNA topoisomerase [Allomuricauda]MDC6367226.1 DNA topoisomerase 3 [Muricauda sp. AC10]
MKTILAEKPSVAFSIASIVGASQKKEGYMEGNGYRVTWAIGHLVGLSMPLAYGHEKWSLDYLPIIPNPFKLHVSSAIGPNKQFQTIKTLFHESTEIIVATDAGREGELIFRYIHTLANTPSNIPIKRLWISDLTDATIKKGLRDLRPAADFDRLYFAAKARSEADWLVGINFTQGFTLASGKNKALSIGRVQTATLKLIVQRYLDDQRFRSTSFYVPMLSLENGEVSLKLSSEDKFEQKELAEHILLNVKGTLSPKITREDTLSSEKPPVLYDLTTLQRTVNKVYGYTAQQTLDMVQVLYEKHKVVSYPRTDSQYLANAQEKDVATVFDTLEGFSINGVVTDTLKKDIAIEGNPVFNDKKVSDHHAIIPTGRSIDLSILKENERNVFLMIVQRFFQTFLPLCKKANRKLFFELNGHTFSASSTQIVELGWRILSPNDDTGNVLPELRQGTQLKIIDIEIHEGKTKPKPLFSDSSLLGAMETAGKLVSDPKIREGLKDRGLGTPATRAAIIETLIKREYVLRNKTKLIPTDMGCGLIDALGDLDICSPGFTGEWEYKLKQIERNELSYADFMLDIGSYVKRTFPSLLESASKVSQIKTPDEISKSFSYGKCPKCKQGEIRKGKKGAYCSNWNQEPKCDFSIWSVVANKKLTDIQITDLLVKRETRKLKGFKSKQGKSFDAQLVLDKDFKVKFSFD